MYKLQFTIYNSFYNSHTNEKVFGVNWITIKKVYIVITKGGGSVEHIFSFRMTGIE